MICTLKAKSLVLVLLLYIFYEILSIVFLFFYGKVEFIRMVLAFTYVNLGCSKMPFHPFLTINFIYYY